jgi:hypothetical protein
MVAKPLVCHRRDHDEWMGLAGMEVKQRHGLGTSRKCRLPYSGGNLFASSGWTAALHCNIPAEWIRQYLPEQDDIRSPQAAISAKAGTVLGGLCKSFEMPRDRTLASATVRSRERNIEGPAPARMLASRRRAIPPQARVRTFGSRSQ